MTGIYTLDIGRYSFSCKKRKGCSRRLPSATHLTSVLSLASWDSRCAKFGKIYSPMDIGVLWLLGVGGGLTREFWADFKKNSFGGS